MKMAIIYSSAGYPEQRAWCAYQREGDSKPVRQPCIVKSRTEIFQKRDIINKIIWRSESIWCYWILPALTLINEDESKPSTYQSRSTPSKLLFTKKDIRDLKKALCADCERARFEKVVAVEPGSLNVQPPTLIQTSKPFCFCLSAETR